MMEHSTDKAVAKFVARIKPKYIERRLDREKQWPPCKLDKLVKLELVEGELRQGYSAGQTRGKDAVDEAIKCSPLAYSDILKAKDGKKTVRKVLVEGDAGIGKTTLCTAITEDWANEKLFREFEILLLLHLRQKRIASAGSLLELLKLLHPSQKVCELVAEYIEEEEGKVLIIADGWDELSTDNRSEGSFLYEFLFDECYSLSVIVTSRPYASAPLRDLPCIDRLVEVRGFSKDNIKEFIQSVFASDKAMGSGLLEQLEGNPLIESVCSVPLNCAIICHLWHHFRGALPTTMSELYTKIVLNVTLRNIQKRPEYKSIHFLSHFDALPESLQQPWSLLCELAFQTLIEDKIVFSHEDLSRQFQNLMSELLCFGLLQSAESILEVGHGVSFHFLHLTFQEYLAALYLVRQPTDKQIQIVDMCVELLSFEVVWMFFFGITSRIYQQPINSGVSKKITNAYNSNATKFTLYQFALEANQTDIDLQVASYIRNSRIGVPIGFIINWPLDYPAFIHVITKCSLHSDVFFDIRNYNLRHNQIEALADALAIEHRSIDVVMIDLSGNKMTDHSVAHLFNRASPAFDNSLRQLILSNNRIGPEAINSITAVLSRSFLYSKPSAYPTLNTQTFDISDNPLGIDGLNALREALCADKLINLVNLSLAGSLTDDPDINAELIVVLGSGHCRSLEYLDLSRNNLGVTGAKGLGKVLPHLHKKVSLYLNETMLGDEGISAFTQSLALEDTCEIGDLELENNDIHAAGLSCLAESIQTGKLISLECSFSLAKNPLGLEAVADVVRMLSSDHFQPHSVELSRCQLTSGESVTSNPSPVDKNVTCKAVWQWICCQVRSNSVTELLIEDNNFDGEGIYILAGFVYICPNLGHLWCKRCKITDLTQLLIQLSELKVELPKLRMLYLLDNEISDNGVSALIEHLSMFPRVMSIDLDGNNQISPEMSEKLRKELYDHYRKNHPSDSDLEVEFRPLKVTMIKLPDDHEDSDRYSSDEAETALLDMEEEAKLISDSEAPSPSKRVKTMEAEGVEQMQPTVLDSEETEAESRSQQEVVHLSTISRMSTQSFMVQRLDEVLDIEHGGVSKHLGQIADAMYEWEGPIAEQLELTRADIAAIKIKYPGELKLQTRAALELWKQRHGSNATYNNLLKVFENAGYQDLADLVRRIILGRQDTDSVGVNPQEPLT